MIIQDDAFLTKDKAQEFENYLLAVTPWTFNQTTNVETANGEAFNGGGETFQFVSRIDPGHSLILPVYEIFNAFITKHNIVCNEVQRIKTNLLTRGKGSNYHSIHIDQDYDHKVFLYYVNDSDGDTVFFDQFWSKENPANINSLTEQIRVKPKQGLGVVFNGLQYHTSTSPIESDFRCVINLDFI